MTYLDVECPRWEVTGLDGVVELGGVEIWVFAGEAHGFVVGEGFDPAICSGVEFDVADSKALDALRYRSQGRSLMLMAS